MMLRRLERLRASSLLLRRRCFCHQRSLATSRQPRTPSASASGTAAPLQQEASAAEAGAPHVPVLLHEVLGLLQPVNVQVYVDCTLGAGGHAVAMVRAHQEMRHLVGIDVDTTAHQIAQARLREVAPPGLNATFHQTNYSQLEAVLRGIQPSSLFGQVDAMLMDLGVSSMQLDSAERGFSFLRDGPIDMRMDPGAKLSAEEVLNTYSEAQLGRIIREYGEEKLWRAVARRIVTAREAAPIRTTQQLADVIGHTQLGGRPGKGKKGTGGGKGIHPATRTFQALRIVVNDELGLLEQAIPAAIEALAPGGRLAVISFHSLEDRIVKHAFLRAAGRPTPDQEHLTHGAQSMDALEELERSATATLVTRKPVIAGDKEVASNARSRSAKLRVIEKKRQQGRRAAHPSESTSLGARGGLASTSQPQPYESLRPLPPGTVKVGPTPDGRGNGAFAVTPIAKDTYVGDYEGELVSQQQYFERYPDGTSDYVTELDDEFSIDASALVHDTHTFSAVHMNHSRSRPNVVRYKDPAAKRVSFFAARGIEAGEELLYDYGRGFWRGREEEELP